MFSITQKKVQILVFWENFAPFLSLCLIKISLPSYNV